ncbi:MAG: dockerin type I repeat-containing protein [Oscillospiraceae bacterium]|jgi:hypothetical protein|nr:dockerin type I repeat-containing protein [Oscillospiraceae bacterium]
MKKLVSLALIITIVLSFSIIAGATQVEPYSLGDVNGDGFIDSSDALEILKYEIGLPNVIEGNPRALAAADIFGNGVVDSRVALEILKFEIGLSSVFDNRGNGDGVTPYNLRWLDFSEGSISFNMQSLSIDDEELLYMIRLYGGVGNHLGLMRSYAYNRSQFFADGLTVSDNIPDWKESPIHINGYYEHDYYVFSVTIYYKWTADGGGTATRLSEEIFSPRHYVRAGSSRPQPPAPEELIVYDVPVEVWVG